MVKIYSVIDIIRARNSVRNYSEKEIPETLLKEITASLKKYSKLPFKTKPRFEFIDSKDLEKQELKKLSTYGIINGARYFIAGIVETGSPAITEKKTAPGWECLVDLGFAFEEIILNLTSSGLGTCWLGGTFNRAGFESRAGLSGGEVLAAVSPLGYKNDRRSLMDSAIKVLSGSKNRKPWEMLFFENTFKNPLKVSGAGNFNKPLEMVRLAPSASNKQPWRIVVEKPVKEKISEIEQNVECCHFFVSRNHYYQKISQKSDLQMIDAGIAMCHFELTCNELGMIGKWERTDKNIIQEILDSFPANEKLVYIASWC